MILAAVQHERAPRNTSSLVAAARRGPSGLYPGIPHVYHAASNPYHPLLYPALFPFKPTMSAFTPSVGKQRSQFPTKTKLLKYVILFIYSNQVFEIIFTYVHFVSFRSAFFTPFTDHGIVDSERRERGRSDKFGGSWLDRR